MEAIAIESYDLIKTQLELNASYSSIFNIAWYGLQPLELGMADTSREPQLEDGIFFGFKEGAYGMQPERLGPYTTTLNPGYDPLIPLYRPWPLFYAVRNANATPMLPYPGVVQKPVVREEAVRAADNVVLLSSDPNSKLRENIENCGIKIQQGNAALTRNTLVIIDGANPPANNKVETDKISKAISAGARIWLMGLTPQSLEFANAVFPYSVGLEERKATSFLKQGTPVFLQGLGHSDFYFSELIPQGGTAMNYGMTGDFVAKSEVILRASNTDWQRWNNRPETSKTGNVFRSEREAKGPDPVIASLKSGDAQIIISTLDLGPVAMQTQQLLIKMLTNLGATASNDNIKEMHALNSNAKLHRALTLELSAPARTVTTVEQALAQEVLQGEATVNPQLNAEYNSRQWRVVSGDQNETIMFARAQRGGGLPVVYVSFWMYSPRSLSNLLAEPDMPSLDMFLKTQGGYKVYLNGRSIGEKVSAGDAENKLSSVNMENGWNHFMIKIVGEDTNIQPNISVRFESADKNYMKQLLSSVVR